MSLTNNTRLRSVPVNGDFEAVADVDLVAETPEAQPLTVSAGIAANESGDWAYSASAEDNGTAGALDLQPGLVYTGPNGGAVRVKITNFDVDEESIIADATDTATMAIYVNSTLVAYADEGFVGELDITAEFNVDTYVGGLQSGDVIRVAIVGGTEETWEAGVAEGGTIDIV